MTAARAHRRSTRAAHRTDARPPRPATTTGPSPDDHDDTGTDRTRRAAPDRHGPRSALRRCRRAPNPPARRPRRRTDADQHGFVTAELAAVLPAVVAVLALSVWAVATAGVKVRAIDAAHSAALAAARGEDAQAVAAPYLPAGSSVSVAHDGDVVRATVVAPSRPLGVLTPAVEVSAQAAAPKEPGLPE